MSDQRDRLAGEACPLCGRRPNAHLRKALAAGVTVGLDVERLAKALGLTSSGERPDGTQYAPRTLRLMAEEIAGEYDRLGGQS